MRKLKYLILAVGTLFVIASCDDNIPQSFNAEDSNASFSKTTASVNENAVSPEAVKLLLHWPVQQREIRIQPLKVKISQ